MGKLISFLFLIFIFIGPAHADTGIDRQVKNALADITKYEQQFAGQTSVNKNSVKRTLKLLKLTRQRLDSAADHSHPSWLEADERHTALVTHLNNLLTPAKAPAAPPVTTTKSGTTATATEAPAQSSPTSATPAPAKQMISQDHVRIKKLTRDITSVTETVDKAGPKPFQDPLYVEKNQKTLNSFHQSLGRYADFPDDKGVIAATEAYQKLEKMLVFGKDHAAKELAAIGDPQQRLTAVHQSLNQLKIPATPQQPFKQGELRQWLANLIKVRNGAIKTYQPLPELKKRAYLPDTRLTVEQGGAYDMKDVVRYDRYLRDIVSKIDKDVNSFTANLDLSVRHTSESLSFYDKLDPADRSHQTSHFLSKGRADEVRQQLASKEMQVGEASDYANFLKHKNYSERIALLDRIKKVTVQYENNYQKALELIRMPKAASTDSDLMEIAEKTLANPKYTDVGEIKRLLR